MNSTWRPLRETQHRESDDEIVEIGKDTYLSSLEKRKPPGLILTTRSPTSPTPGAIHVRTQSAIHDMSRADPHPDRSLPQRVKLPGRSSPRYRTYSPSIIPDLHQRNINIKLTNTNGSLQIKRQRDEINDSRVLEKRNKRRCTECVATGLECDGERPCSRCCEPGFDCIYAEDGDNEMPSNVILSGGHKMENNTPYLNNTWPHLLKIPTLKVIPQSIAKVQEQTTQKDVLTTVPHASTSPSIVGDENEETMPVDLQNSTTPQTFNEIKDLIEDHKKNLDLHREYIVQTELTRSKLAGQQCSKTFHPKLKDNPWKKFGEAQDPSTILKSEPLQLTIQTKTYRGSAPKRFSQITIRAGLLKDDVDVPILPKYKSIGRLGSSFLSRNVHTLKFMPYYPDDECPTDLQETANKEAELKDAYKHVDVAFHEQRRCLETVFQWSEQFFDLLNELNLDVKKLTTWLKQSGVGKCGKCGVNFANSEVASEFTALFDKPSHANAMRCMRLNQAFGDVINVGIWHFLETKPGSFRSDIRSAHSVQRASSKNHGVCSVCSVYGCLSHGSFVEDEDNDESVGLINDPEDGYNKRNMVTLLTSKKTSEHICGVFCLPDLFEKGTSTSQIYGVKEDGAFTGQRNDQIVPISETAAFQDTELCSPECFLNLRNRRTHLPEAKKIDLTQHPALRARVCTLTRMFHKHVRLPCIIAKTFGNKTRCVDAFEILLNVHHLHPHPVPDLQIDDAQQICQGRKISQIVAGYDMSQSRFVEKRRPFVPCSHDGPCLTTSDCPCAHDKVHCEQTCGCAGDCKRRFKGCRCKGPCFNDDRCECWRNNRECDPWLCGNCGVVEVLDPSNKYREDIRQGRCHNNRIQLGLPARTIKARSEIQGWGLYAGENLDPFSFVGEYRGEIIQNDEASRRGVIYHYNALEYLFKINNTQEIDGSNFGNKTRFMNNSQRDENINVQAKTLLCNGIQRVMFYTKRAVKAGEELLYNYNYPEWVYKAFWEKGEEHIGSNGLVKPLAKPIISGRFTRTTIGKNDGEESAARKLDQAVMRKGKRKRPEDDEDGAGVDENMDKAIDKLSNDAQASLGIPQEADPSDDSDYRDEVEQSTSGSDGSQASDGAVSEGSSEGQAQPRTRRIFEADRRRGGSAQKKAWLTRKASMNSKAET